jgi:uncharacterized protein
MLIEFTVGNYRSFKDRKTLSLEATSISDFPENVFTIGRYKLLKSVVLYGANASGKSNFLQAMIKMADLVTDSFDNSSVAELDVEPFLLNTETINAPSFFDIVFLIENTAYRYGFELTKKEIISEWLFEVKKTTEKQLFLRDKNAIDTSKFIEGKSLENRTRDNALFLSVVDKFNGELAGKIVKFFATFTNFDDLSELKHSVNEKLFNSDKNQDDFLKFLTHFNLGFDNIRIENVQLDNTNEQNINRYKTLHKLMDKSGNIVGITELDMLKNASSGTNKIVDLSGILFNYLRLGLTLIIDELDAKLHPLITLNLIHLFNSEKYNPNHAQLIFATHDTNLLSRGNFRRDQVYLVEKNKFQASDLYSLVEFKLDKTGAKVRKDNSFEKDYLDGKYGAIPFIGEFSMT